MSSTEVPSSEVIFSRWSRIWRCTVTSRADVGSSAMSRRGWQDRPMAISARWRMPPENSCGYCLARRAASGRPACARTLATSSGPLGRPLAFSVSLTWSPIFQTGFRLDIGSCGTMPMMLPRSSIMRFSEACEMSSPSSRICPPATRPLPGSRPIAASAVVDLPEPDSPTMATVSPGHDGQVCVAHGLDLAAAGLEGDREIADFQQWPVGRGSGLVNRDVGSCHDCLLHR